jgi:hypothetical protein
VSCFFFLTFLKNKLHNSLDEHLEVVVGMYSQKFVSFRASFTIPILTSGHLLGSGIDMVQLPRLSDALSK